MKLPFKRHRASSSNVDNIYRFQEIRIRFEILKYKLALYLLKWTKRQSRSKLIIISGLLMMLIISYNLYLIIGSPSRASKIAPISASISTKFNITPKLATSENLSPTYWAVINFSNYLDSLRDSGPQGFSFYQDFISARPGLIDSIQLFKQFYLSNKSNEDSIPPSVFNPK